MRNGAKFRIGSSPDADIQLRDPTASAWAADWNGEHLEAAVDAPSFRILDLDARYSAWPEKWRVSIGESVLEWCEEDSAPQLPATPSGTKSWRTFTPEGSKTLWGVRKAAETPLSVYLCGETGTGKEVLAHLLHAWSPRVGAPFIPLHCGALPASLAESELFGHVKGSFTGAHRDRPGALLQAHGGTLFLDEIGDLSLELQVKLLRFLEDGEIRPVGSDRTTRADVRIVCATHHRLDSLVAEGKFRQDLYYRIASVTVEIPPLRTRPRDVAALADSFAKEFGKSLTPRAKLRLQAHTWPGNVRELRHAIERAVGFSGAGVEILPEDAFSFLYEGEKGLQAAAPTGCLTLEEMEREMLVRALRLTSGNRGEAAKILGIARSTLFEMLKRHRIQGPRRPILVA